MRPNFIKSKPEPAHDVEDISDEVAETQSHVDAINEQDSDSDESDYASDASHTPKKRRVQKKEKKTEEIKEKPKEGGVKTAARKIKATAHANYRRLKIKGKGATGGKGKFGRRR